MVPNRLDFSLPEFTRVSWASDAAREVWSPRLQRITRAWLDLEWLSVAEGVRPCAILSQTPRDFFADSATWLARGLAAWPVEDPATVAPGAAASDPPAEPRRAGGREGAGIVVGTLEDLVRFRAAYERSDHAEIGSLLGVPPCCHEFFRRVWVDEGWCDTTWAMALGSVEAPRAERTLTVSGPPECNILWRWMGVRAVPHLPCSTACRATAQLGRLFLELGRRSGKEAEMDWLEEILGWPLEWTALHGIAEIKTPVLKVTTQTDATAEKLAVRRASDRYPAEGARGLGFPYRAEASPRVVVSAAFRRGLENPIVPSLELERWYATDNGFGSVEAMMRAHQPIVGLVREALGKRAGTVLDLGCGNGALLRQLRQLNGALEVFGIDADAERIAHARQLLPESAANFLCGDIFDLELPGAEASVFSVVLLMPGRLVEAGAERATQLLRRLEGRCERLLVYAYGDWLTRYQDLNGLISLIPGLVARDCRDAKACFAEIAGVR